jgi:hypothetical protein
MGSGIGFKGGIWGGGCMYIPAMEARMVSKGAVSGRAAKK